jgi:hypothetical protein
VGKTAGQYVVFAVLAVAGAGSAAAQSSTIQFPSTGTAVPSTGSAVPATGVPSVNVTVPPASGSFPTTPSATSPYLSNPATAAPFDPYSASGSSAYQFWSITPPAGSAPGAAPGVITATPSTSPYLTTPGTTPGFGPPPAGTSATPQYLFPNGTGQPIDLSQSLRFIQDLRLRQTWLEGGDDPNDLDINDTEVALTFTWPNFLTTGQPLFISPAFALHLWDGPSHMPADLPPQAYSAYLDMQWATDPKLHIGAELGFRVGVYTDFNTLNEDSLRLQGLGLGVFHLTPTMTAKIGVMYLDRNKIKLLPAGGLLWTPTPHVRFDIFFPQPKLSAYLTTLGKHEVWWYLAGEYGGGAWTIERADGSSDRIDINDIRVSAGFEWTGPKGFTGFFEAGFVFEREVVYVVTPSDTFDADDTFMLRAGFSW